MDLRINAWNADLIVGKIQNIFLHCFDYFRQRGGLTASSDQVVTFLRLVGECMNMYYPEKGQPVRPILKLETLTLLFDNGISETTDHDNYPILYLSGVPFEELSALEGEGVSLRRGDDFAVFSFSDDLFRYGNGFANVQSAIPNDISQEITFL